VPERLLCLDMQDCGICPALPDGLKGRRHMIDAYE